MSSEGGSEYRSRRTAYLIIYYLMSVRTFFRLTARAQYGTVLLSGKVLYDDTVMPPSCHISCVAAFCPKLSQAKPTQPRRRQRQHYSLPPPGRTEDGAFTQSLTSLASRLLSAPHSYCIDIALYEGPPSTFSPLRNLDSTERGKPPSSPPLRPRPIEATASFPSSPLD